MQCFPMQGMESRGHEQVVYFHYPEVGLKAIVGIHNTVLGPALGGCRMRIYESEQQALDDVLRLSEGMTYKSSLAGLNLGGGKCCLLVDPQMKEGREQLFEQFGQCLNHLGGRYITAEDMGTSVEDISVMRRITRFAAGFAQSEGGSGDPSPWTARGVFQSILAASERMFGSKSLEGKKVAVQGVGHVGKYLCGHLAEAGAKLTVTDTSQDRVQEVVREYGAEAVHLEAIYDVQCDIYAPCAVGQTVNDSTIPRLGCKIIAGAANNVLTSREVLPELRKKGILYCPDFLINAGGVISVGAEYNEGGWNKSWVEGKVDAIFDTLNRVLDEAEKRAMHAEDVAVELAKERIKAKQG